MTLTQIASLKARVARGSFGGLLDDPDCLAELEHVYSVFRFRYVWGTVHEITFGPEADAYDRHACFALLPCISFWAESIETDTLGIDGKEVTHRAVCLDR